MVLDVQGTIDALLTALRGAAGTGWTAISGFASKQAPQLVHQAEMIAQSRANGSLKDDDELFQFFVDQLADSVKEVAHYIAAMTVLTIEKAWNAMVGVIWGALQKALGALPWPALPAL
jgi:adenylate kinase